MFMKKICLGRIVAGTGLGTPGLENMVWVSAWKIDHKFSLFQHLLYISALCNLSETTFVHVFIIYYLLENYPLKKLSDILKSSVSFIANYI